MNLTTQPTKQQKVTRLNELRTLMLNNKGRNYAWIDEYDALRGDCVNFAWTAYCRQHRYDFGHDALDLIV